MHVKSRKEEQAEATRRALIDNARLLFAERGFSAVSLDEVAQKTRVTKGAVYHHFKGKKELFHAAAQEAHQELAQVVEAVSEEHEALAPIVEPVGRRQFTNRADEHAWGAVNRITHGVDIHELVVGAELALLEDLECRAVDERVTRSLQDPVGMFVVDDTGQVG